MLTVACVLRVSGNTYNALWAQRLKRNVEKNLTIPHRFVCLTNLSFIEGVETQKLTENFPGWWSKIELFKPDQFEGHVLYMDIDMMTCGNIDKLAGPWTSLVMLKDCPAFRTVSNSGLMWWNAEKNSVYENIFHDFEKDKLEIMKTYSGVKGVTMFGDQGFIDQTMKKYEHPILKWQDILPESWFLEFSYLDKINPIVADGSYDKDVRICYSLGYPKFANMPELPIVKDHWS